MLSELSRLVARKPWAIDALCVKLVCNERDLRKAVHSLRQGGFNVKISDGFVTYTPKRGPVEKVLEFGTSAPGRYRIAHISDIHFGSETCDERGLLTFLKRAHKSGIKHIVCTGDILDGNKPVLLPEQRWHTFDGQLGRAQRLFSLAPKFESVSAITGNHDGYFDESIGTETGRIMQDRMRAAGVNWHYAGACLGNVTVHGARFHMHHPHGGAGTRNAVRRVMNARVEAMSNERQPMPDFLLIGHFHKYAAIPIYPENVYCVASGTYQKKGSTFSNRLSSGWDVGSQVLSWRVMKDGTVTERASDFYPSES